MDRFVTLNNDYLFLCRLISRHVILLLYVDFGRDPDDYGGFDDASILRVVDDCQYTVIAHVMPEKKPVGS